MAMQKFVATYTSDSGGRSGATTESGYSYDPTTGTWVPAVQILGGDSTDDTVPDSFTDGDSHSQTDTKTSAEKEYIDTEFRTLEGEAVVVPSNKAIRLKVNNTVRFEGLGRYLSGDYFVSAIKRTISKDGGYSQTLTVIKNGFGESLKKAYSNATGSDYRYSSDTAPDTSGAVVDRKVPVEKESSSAIKEGDNVQIVGENAVYSNAHEGVKVPAWVKKKVLTVKQFSSDGNRVLLMPINSWTYLTYVKKV